MEVAGGWLGVKERPEFQSELVAAATNALERVHEIYDTFGRLDCSGFGFPLSELISAVSFKLYQMLCSCATFETWAQIQQCKIATQVGFSVWTTHSKE